MLMRSEKKTFPFEVTLLASCLAEGASRTANGAEGGGGVARVIVGSDHPNPWQ